MTYLHLPTPATVRKSARIRTIQNHDTLMHERVENAKEVPARVHTKTKLRYHERIQKKWNKRFGYAEIVRANEPKTFAEVHRMVEAKIDAAFAGTARSLRPRQRTPKRADGHFVDPEQNRLANEADMAALCTEMIAQCAEHGHSEVQFNVADSRERSFIERYMHQHASHIGVSFTVG